MSKEGRVTKIELDRRVFVVQGWIINRVPDYLILKQCQDQFKITERQSKNYLQKAYKIWREANVATIDEQRQMQIDKLKQDQRSLKDVFKGTPAGMRAVLAIDKEIHRLQALHPGKTIILAGDPEKPLEINSSEARERRIKELVAKALEE